MYAQWLLLVMMLPGWLMPSGVALSWCGCALQMEAESSGICCSTMDELPSCCEPAPGTHEQSDGNCCCTVEAPEHDDGLAPATTTVSALPQLALSHAWLSYARPPVSKTLDTGGRPNRPRGPSPGTLRVPLRL